MTGANDYRKYLVSLLLSWATSGDGRVQYPRAVLAAARRRDVDPREVYAEAVGELGPGHDLPPYDEVGPPGA